MLIEPVFGVIPTVAVGGPLAILSMLFPALFGSPKEVLRRWSALLGVASVVSLLYLYQSFTNWPSPLVLWLTMAGVTLAGVVWGWRRHRHMVDGGMGEALRPSRGEEIGFRVLSVVCIGLLGYCLGAGVVTVSPWKEFLVMAPLVWAGTLGVTYLGWEFRKDPDRPPGLPLEAAMLSALAFACLGMASTVVPPRPGPVVEATEHYVLRQLFQPEDPGRIDSTPLVTEDRIYIAGSTIGTSRWGTVYCLDRATGKKLWSFDDNEAMKEVFSSPFLVGDRLFIGEGYHQHTGCKLYCLNAGTGEKIWEFATRSHTESSPVVVDGKVYFGAGDDGVYCVDAQSGKQVWHLPNLHVDTTPTVAGGRVYGGSGYGTHYFIFCLDAATGEPIWREEWKLPVFGSPTVAGDHVYFGTGNGNMLQSDPRPAGALLCVNAATGRLAWPAFEVPDSVLTKPAVDQKHVYFGSRDGHLYAVRRRDGQLAWKKDLGSPVVSSPALVACSICGHASTLYAATDAGKFFCLEPDSGAESWKCKLPAHLKPQIISSPRVFVSRNDKDGRRRIYFGAVLEKEGETFGALYCVEDKTSGHVRHSSGTE